jgi:hypothetical protein
VVLYSQQEEDRPTIVNELRQIINNTEFLKGSTEPPKLVRTCVVCVCVCVCD